ncbi:DUF1622 domain-containing protein [Pseudonocardia alaniniphila]|uniref:DUF1622 domain-containing protein n=1 Tax=Pseudonocardia alaniniphila TaxID=75291 RepID=A0ABS9TSY5_9PSEU|nr:DUF1622 domain-containing protein [Pseudonocardia alaniniphila]MCH6171669.1 DUF1622 domain-containing protein [Pseudonocardia alaniniphila]
MLFDDVIEKIGMVIDAAGVAIIAVGAAIAVVVAVIRLAQRRAGGDVYRQFRRMLARTVLLGLELLVAADIVRTVAILPSLNSVAVLGGIVLIRTFLSFSLELEITGRWPWQKSSPSNVDSSYEAGRNSIGRRGRDRCGRRRQPGMSRGRRVPRRRL